MKKNKEKKKFKINKQERNKLIKEMLIIVVLVVAINFVVGFGRVQSDSMDPTVKKGKFIVVQKVLNEYKEGDLVLIDYEGKHMVRRVVATVGDVVDINNKKGQLMINDEVVTEDYATGKTVTDPVGVKFPVAVEKDQVFVLADQRSYTSDSRLVGCLNSKYIVGKVIIQI